ncbi:MAG: NAD(P)/FAD-dependent oxidoreductase [bacterium]|nr:NAD(P)/FAD-dependent oxidoreductase [bacterium]
MGAGSAGVACALKLSEYGFDVTIFEGENIGGVCLNYGCIPSKLFLEEVSRCNGEVNLNELIDKKSSVINKLRNIIIDKLNKSGVKVINAYARFLNKNTIIAAGQTYEFDKVIIATGLKENIPNEFSNIDGLLNIRNIFELKRFPKSILIVGAGFTGFEMAWFFAKAKVKVYIYDILEDVLSMFSNHVKRFIIKNMNNMGVEFITGVKVVDVSDGVIKKVRFENGKVIEIEEIFIAAGMKYIDTVGVREIGVKVSKYIDVNESFMTNIDGVYAIGDVNGIIQLAHAAEIQGVIVAEHIAEGKEVSFSVYDVPICLYTKPAIAKVGITNIEADKLNIKLNSYRGYFGGSALGVIKSIEGIFEVFYDDSGYILGAQACGECVEELIHIICVCIKGRLKVKDLAQIIIAHPSLSEVIKPVNIRK